MKTRNLHQYHGITNNNSVGWAVQIKLLGKYRVLRAYADDAETTARRHDFALCVLEAFTEPSAVPNFPAVFDQIQHYPPTETIDDNEAHFRKLVFAWREELVNDVQASGGDVNELDIQRHQRAQKLRADNKRAAQVARANFLTAVDKLQRAVPNLKLSDSECAKVDGLFNTMLSVLENAPNP